MLKNQLRERSRKTYGQKSKQIYRQYELLESNLIEISNYINTMQLENDASEGYIDETTGMVTNFYPVVE